MYRFNWGLQQSHGGPKVVERVVERANGTLIDDRGEGS